MFIKERYFKVTQENLDQEQKKVSTLLLIGICFLPFIFSWFTLRKGYSTKSRVISFIYTFIIIIITIGSSEEKNKSNNNLANNKEIEVIENKYKSETKQIQETKEPEKQIEKITASGLIQAYADNEVAADDRFKGEKIHVVGVVKGIEKDFFGNSYVMLHGNDFNSVQYFNPENKDDLIKLKKGKKITVEGVVKSMILGNVSLHRGNIIN